MPARWSSPGRPISRRTISISAAVRCSISGAPRWLKAIESFEQAVAIDPDYAPAFAGLARALVLYAFWGWVEPGAVLERASEAAAHALRSDPQLGEAHAAAALVAFAARFDRAEAHAEWERAIALATDSDADSRIARAMFDLGYAQADFTLAVQEIVAALEVDPLSSSGYAGLAVMNRSAGNVVAARSAARRARELDPDSLYAYWATLYALSGGDAIDEARQIAREAIAKLGTASLAAVGGVRQPATRRRRAGAVARYEELVARSRTDYVQPAVLCLMAACVGRADEAVVWLRRAIDIRDSLILGLMAQFRELRSVLHRPDVQDLLQRMNWVLPTQR